MHRQLLLLGARLAVWLHSRPLSDPSCGIRDVIVVPPKVGRHTNSHESSQLKYRADDGVMHVSEVENTSAFPEIWENDTLERSSRASPPRASEHNG